MSKRVRLSAAATSGNRGAKLIAAESKRWLIKSGDFHLDGHRVNERRETRGNRLSSFYTLTNPNSLVCLSAVFLEPQKAVLFVSNFAAR